MRRNRFQQAAAAMAAALCLGVSVASLGPSVAAQVGDSFNALRSQMVDQQLKERDITDRKLLHVMSTVPRHLFVPEELRSRSYADEALRISDKLTIHQPYVIAFMTSLLELNKGSRVLEIGTGTGYHSAILSELAFQVFSIEIDKDVGKRARYNLERYGARNVHLRIGDGYQGWEEHAPYDAIILTAAPPRIPHPLIDQLRRGGKMVVPVGTLIQDLLVLEKTEEGIEKRHTVAVKLPPMTGEVQNQRARP